MVPTHRLTACVLLTALVSGCTGEAVIENGEFDLWCGDELCGWRIYQDGDGNRYGSVKQVPTWHESEKGAELISGDGGRDAILYQTLRDIDESCLVFTVQANVSEGAELSIAFDYLADDPLLPERTVRITGDDWDTTLVEAPMPDEPMPVSVVFRKSGPGTVVLSRVDVAAATACAADMPVITFADGAPCEADEGCKSGLCEREPSTSGVSSQKTCSACDDARPCDGSLVCGLDFSEAHQTMFQGCGEAARHVLGELCRWDAECATGICCAGKCATCCDDIGCPDGQQCRHLSSEKPDQCAPEQGLGAPDDFCLSDLDCASGVCEAEAVLRACEADGRPCTDDGDCRQGFKSGACVALGYYDGVCR